MDKNKRKTIALILASGTGERSGLNVPKQFFQVAGKTLLEHAVEAFEGHPLINEIIIVSNINYIAMVENIVVKNKYEKVTKVIAGGVTRKDSSYIGINSIEDDNAKVLIHDAARPFISVDIITECVEKLDIYDAINTAIDSVDTLVKVNDNGFIEEVPERKYYMRAQTPQAFNLKIIKQAHKFALEHPNLHVTDDCGLVMNARLCDIYIVKGDDLNMKITYPNDIVIAEMLYQQKVQESI